MDDYLAVLMVYYLAVLMAEHLAVLMVDCLAVLMVDWLADELVAQSAVWTVAGKVEMKAAWLVVLRV